ncbi:protein SOGA3-like [Manacus candei]|uniref:protein SOGA3-like n=1 Tax=Manacus candei TaxID=415023 RepID=UPI002226CDCB|nr:protein SOGA3-like [Manacus candei]
MGVSPELGSSSEGPGGAGGAVPGPPESPPGSLQRRPGVAAVPGRGGGGGGGGGSTGGRSGAPLVPAPLPRLVPLQIRLPGRHLQPGGRRNSPVRFPAEPAQRRRAAGGGGGDPPRAGTGPPLDRTLSFIRRMTGKTKVGKKKNREAGSGIRSLEPEWDNGIAGGGITG